MSEIVTKSIDSKNYVVGEVILQSLPVEFNGELKHFKDLEELKEEVQKDFPGWENFYMRPGFYRILMEIPEHFTNNAEDSVSFASLMIDSIKTVAYTIDNNSGKEEDSNKVEAIPVGKVEVNFKPKLSTLEFFNLLIKAEVSFYTVGKQVSVKNLQVKEN